MKLSGLKRLITEDYAKEDQDLVNKLALVLNPMIDQLVNLFDKRLDFINLNRQLKTFTVKTTANGTPINAIQVKSELKTKAAGINVIKAAASSSGIYVTSSPFLTFSEQEGLINISNIQGLPANQEFTLTIEIIGENTG